MIAIVIAVGVGVHSVSVRCDIMTCNAYNRADYAHNSQSKQCYTYDWGTSGLFIIRYRYQAYNVAGNAAARWRIEITD